LQKKLWIVNEATDFIGLSLWHKKQTMTNKKSKLSTSIDAQGPKEGIHLPLQIVGLSWTVLKLKTILFFLISTVYFFKLFKYIIQSEAHPNKKEGGKNV
jgi:hypothetical protein